MRNATEVPPLKFTNELLKCISQGYWQLFRGVTKGGFEKTQLVPNPSTTSSNLKRHSRLHTGLKPYQCSVCDYSCTNSSNLRRHAETHSNERPFSCCICGNCFNRAAMAYIRDMS